MADSSIIENLSEGVLTAFFGSFLGAAVGKDLAGITVNLLSSGIEKIGAKTFETITQDRTNHDIQKLASASLHASVNDVLSESNDVGGKVTWRDSQKKALSELREYSKNQFMSESDVAGRIVSATMVGLSAEVENSVRQMIQPFLEQKDTIDKERLTQEISKRFFFNFNELYKSEKHEKGRLAIERDIARALLQGLNSQNSQILLFRNEQRENFEKLQAQLKSIEVNGLRSWEPQFTSVLLLIDDRSREIKQHVSDQFARERLINEANEKISNAKKQFISENYQQAASSYNIGAEIARDINETDLEAAGLLGSVQSEINQFAIKKAVIAEPRKRWTAALDRVRDLNVRGFERLITMARVEILCGDLAIASDCLQQASKESEESRKDVEIAQLSSELLRRRVLQKDTAITSQVIAESEEAIRNALHAADATEVIIAYLPLIETLHFIGVDHDKSLRYLQDVVDRDATNKLPTELKTQPIEAKIAIQMLGNASHRLFQTAIGKDMARLAMKYVTKHGDTIDQARIGDILARHFCQEDPLTKGLLDEIKLREDLCDKLTGNVPAISQLDDDRFDLYVHHFSLAIVARYQFARVDVNLIEAEEWLSIANGAQKSIEFIDAGLNRLKGDVDNLAAQLHRVKAESLVNIGDYSAAAVAFEHAVQRGLACDSSPEVLYALSSDCVYFYCSAGDLPEAKRARDLASSFYVRIQSPKKNLEQIDRLISTTEETRKWLSSQNADEIRRIGRLDGIRAAIQPTVKHLYELWDDIPKEEVHCSGAVYDYWGRGSFLRLCVAIQGKPTDCFTVDATTIDEIRNAAEVLCPMFEVVMVKWKGPLLGAAKGMTFGYVRTDRKQDWLYGSGLVHGKDHFWARRMNYLKM
jgi:hypothetical protein